MDASTSQFIPRAVEIAQEAGKLLLSYYGRVTVQYKGDVDLVTEADRQAETLITQRLRSRFPEHQIVGEEGARHSSGSDYRWYVDPLDGTTNFAHGFPVFAVSLGLEYKDELIAGVVYDPTREELFSAEKGSGAFVTAHNNITSNNSNSANSSFGRLRTQPIHVSNIATLAESLVGTGFPSHKRHQSPNIHFYYQITLRSHGVRRTGSAALDLCNVACGRLDGFWEFSLHPWDTAAGVVIIREAGGQVTDFDGKPFDIESKEVLASNGLIHTELKDNFTEIFAGRGLADLPNPMEYRKRN